MPHEMILAFPLAIHDPADVERTTPAEFLAAARRRMTLAAMLAQSSLGDGGELIADAIELTYAADAKAAGKTVTVGSDDAPLERLWRLSSVLVAAVDGMEALDEVELDAMRDLLLALANGLDRHVAREEREFVASKFKSAAEVAAANVLAGETKRSKRSARGKQAKRAA